MNHPSSANMKLPSIKKHILYTYYTSKLFSVVTIEVGAVDSIPMSVKKQINYARSHQEDSSLTCEAYIPSIINTLKKIIIAIDLYKKYVSKFYDGFRVDLYKLEF